MFSRAVSLYPKHVAGYWAKVARIVGTRSAEECHNQHTSQGASQTPAKKAKKPKKKKIEAPKDPGRKKCQLETIDYSLRGKSVKRLKTV